MAQTVKNLLAMQETWVPSLGWENPWRREWLPTPVFLPGEFQTEEYGGLHTVVVGTTEQLTLIVFFNTF